MESVVASRDIIEAIDREFPLEPVTDQRPAPPTRFKFRDGSQGGIGVIPSGSDAFCKVCTRIPLTPRGHLPTPPPPSPDPPLQAPLPRRPPHHQLPPSA